MYLKDTRPHVLENRSTFISGSQFISRSNMADSTDEILSVSIHSHEYESVIAPISTEAQQGRASGVMCPSTPPLSEIEAPEPSLESCDVGTPPSLGFMPQKCPIPGGLRRILYKMGLLQKDQTQEEILFSIRAPATERVVPDGSSETSSDLSEDSSSDSLVGLLETQHENTPDRESQGET